MNENERLENQIDQQIKILDAFSHPRLSDQRAAAIVHAMTNQKHRTGVFRLIFQIAVPLAAAAGLVLAVWLFLPPGSQSGAKPGGTQIETASIWSLYPGSQEKEIDTLFADLDFSSATTQPATTQTADETVDEMDRYLMEIMAKS